MDVSLLRKKLKTTMCELCNKNLIVGRRYKIPVSGFIYCSTCGERYSSGDLLCIYTGKKNSEHYFDLESDYIIICGDHKINEISIPCDNFSGEAFKQLAEEKQLTKVNSDIFVRI